MRGCRLRAGSLLIGLAALVLVTEQQPQAGVPSVAVRDVAELLFRKLGRAAAHQTTQTLAVRLQRLVLRYGDDVLIAARRVGPQSLSLIEGAGEFTPQAVRLLARHGEEAVGIVAHPRQLALVAQQGDDAVAVLLRHQDVAAPLLEAHARPALEALSVLTPQNGRRLAMLQQSGDLLRIGRTEELLDVIARFGNRALEFVWENKGALAVAAVLARFLADPEPFLNGAVKLSSIVAESAIRPVAEIPGRVAEHAARQTDWTLVTLLLLGVATVGLWLRSIRRRRQRKHPVVLQSSVVPAGPAARTE